MNKTYGSLIIIVVSDNLIITHLSFNCSGYSTNNADGEPGTVFPVTSIDRVVRVKPNRPVIT